MQRLTGDDGAVAVVVALLLTALLGFGSLVLDVGQIYAERRQLQNGADAAALAVAPGCPLTGGCAAGADAIAAAKANQNSNDNAATVASPSGPAICGVGGALPACNPASGLGPWDCRPVPAGVLGTNFVQVRTQTLESGGGNLVPPVLARVLAPGYTGSTVRACARVSWGGPSALDASLALTISYCEWDVATNGGTTYAPEPPYPPNPPTSVEHVLKLHSTSAAACPKAGHSGFDNPGAFGWLDDPDSSCRTYIDSNSNYGDDPGVGVSSPCKTALDAAWAAPHQVMYLPVYDDIIGTGNNATYHLKGFAAFVITGFNLPGAKQDSWLYPSNPARCSGSDKCVYGFFTKGLVPVSGTIGGPSMGVTVYQMSG